MVKFVLKFDHVALNFVTCNLYAIIRMIERENKP